MMTALPSFLLLAVALALAPRSALGTTLSAISPQYGSVAGGTRWGELRPRYACRRPLAERNMDPPCRLTITGNGFGDMYSDMAVVYVGSYPCSVIVHLSTSEVVRSLV